MNAKLRATLPPAPLAALLFFTACGDASEAPAAAESKQAQEAAHGDHDGHSHAAEDSTAPEAEEAGDDSHEETPLGTAFLGDLAVTFSQGHGKVAAGKEGHLVVKLPYNDQGATIVRAWIGREDRTLSLVGKAEYAASHDDYDVHAIAPDPLPLDAMWWVELEKPDGTKHVLSITPIRD